MPGESNAFEATARRVTHDWMRHLGYTDDAIEKAENMTCEQAGCQMFGEGHWDHSDENGDSLHPERDELEASGELVMFVMERLAVVERDPTAELIEAALEWAEAKRVFDDGYYDSEDESSGGIWPSHDEAYRRLEQAEDRLRSLGALHHAEAALARHRGEP